MFWLLTELVAIAHAVLWLFWHSGWAVFQQLFARAINFWLWSPLHDTWPGPHSLTSSSSCLARGDVQSSRAPLSRWVFLLMWQTTCPLLIGQRNKLIILSINCPLSSPFSSEELIGEDMSFIETSKRAPSSDQWAVWRAFFNERPRIVLSTIFGKTGVGS